MNVLTFFNEGLNKVFQRAFEYAPPQGQESCKIHVSRNCTASSAHYQMTHGCCCEDWGSMMLVFQAHKITPVLLCHRYVDACAVGSDKVSSEKLHFCFLRNNMKTNKQTYENQFLWPLQHIENINTIIIQINWLEILTITKFDAYEVRTKTLWNSKV